MVNINNLFKLISMKGITQSKLAEDTSVSTGNISDWKKGKSMPSAVKLDELQHISTVPLIIFLEELTVQM